MLTTFPPLTDVTLKAANLLGNWLAERDFPSQPHHADAELVVLAGNAVIPTIDAACQIVAAGNQTLLLSGGTGHSTHFLYAAIAQHPRYHKLATTGRSEAVILADIAHQFWGIAWQRIIVEEKSTNCGENARFTHDWLKSAGINCKTGVVVQDPTMQRRTMATFARVWQGDETAPHWLSYSGCTAVLRNSDAGLTFVMQDSGLWPVARYLSLLLGELPRLQDNAQGYGPCGKDFIIHVDIPVQIQQAWQTLHDDPLLANALACRALK